MITQKKRVIAIICLLIVGASILIYGVSEVYSSTQNYQKLTNAVTHQSNGGLKLVDSYPEHDWLNYFRIQTEPKRGDYVINNDVVFRIYAETLRPMDGFYVHILHEDLKDNFKTSNDLQKESEYQNMTLNNVPRYKNEWVFNTIMNYTSYSNPSCIPYLNATKIPAKISNDCTFSYNGLSNYTFKYPGKYLAQFIVKERDGHIRTYESPLTVMSLPDPQSVEVQNYVEKIFQISQIVNETSIRGEGFGLIAIGTSLIIAAISMRDVMISEEKWIKQEIEKRNRIKNILKILRQVLIFIGWQSWNRERLAKEYNMDPVQYAENETLIVESQANIRRGAEELNNARQLSLLPVEIEESLRKISLASTKRLVKDNNGKFYLLDHSKLQKMINDLNRELRKYENSI